MAQLSKYKMDKDLEERMFSVFYFSLAKLTSERDVEDFLYDLLSPSEQTMLAKRLSIAILLTKGNTYYEIRDTLKVSTATILKIKSWLNGGGSGYRTVISRLLTEEGVEEMLDNVSREISNIIPPRRGSNWTQARSEQWKSRYKRRKKRTI